MRHNTTTIVKCMIAKAYMGTTQRASRAHFRVSRAEDSAKRARIGSLSKSVQGYSVLLASILPLLAVEFVAAAGLVQTGKLTASDAYTGQEFGQAVAIDGDTMVVGTDAGEGIGAAYVYIRNDGGPWIEQAKLVASDGAPGDVFGGSVDIDGDVIVVGALGDDDHGLNSGSAYIFVRDPASDTWTQTAKLNACDADPLDLFGRSVAIYYQGSESFFGGGYTVVVGAPRAGFNPFGDIRPRTGVAYVFSSETGSAWFDGSALLPDADVTAGFGWSVAMDSGFDVTTGHSTIDYVLVGAPFDSGRLGTPDTGAAYVYSHAGIFGGSACDFGTGHANEKFVANDGEPGDLYGWSVDIEVPPDPAGCVTGLVGAPGDFSNGLQTGSAYPVSPHGCLADPFFHPPLVPSNGGDTDDFGISVALEVGDGGINTYTALIGARRHSGSGLSFAGAAYEFVIRPIFENVWSESARLIASDAAASDLFGEAVALDGESGAVGAINANGGALRSGAVYAFEGNTLVADIENLIEVVEQMNLQQGINSGLDAKLDVINRALADANQNNDAAVYRLLLAFIEHVQSQAGNQLTTRQAGQLAALATTAIADLSD